MTEFGGRTRAGGVDARALRAALEAAVRGEVAFDTTARALMTMDASNYRRVPLGVVAPRDADDVAAVLSVCGEQGVPVVARGGGTSIAGQATGTGVVLDFTRHMNRLMSLDPEARTAVVQPGLVLDRLQEAAAPHGLRFGPAPSTHSRCTLGGMIGNNSCGSHSVAWGTTADSVRELSVLSGRGERLRPGQGWAGAPDGLRPLVARELARLRTGFPDLPRRISGYALDALLPEKGADVARAFCGSEGTLGILTEAVVRLVEAPRARALAVLAYADESAAAEAAPELLPYGPLTVEGMAADLVPPGSAGLPRGGAWLFVETGGDTPGEARANAEAMVRAAGPGGSLVDSLVVTDAAAQRALWRIREDASGTATRMPDGSEAWPGWEDCAVPPTRLGAYLRDFRTLLREHDLRGTPYGHFGDGCIHVRIDFDLLTGPGIARFRRFSEELAELVVSHGGSLSGEHGDGQARAELLPKMYGAAMVGLFEQVKAVWDPDDLLNPGMLVRPAPLDSNLRFAVLPRGEPPVPVVFGYPEDGGDFSAAVRRCVGVAKCRTTEVSPASGAVMCPSFRATGEEEHSTRGRARLLHEMLAGEVVTDGWRSPEVRDALDLCLSCKGCRSDCPVGVDMATYKAEFLHHHYAGRRRPAAHYAMGWLPVWLRLVARTRTAGLVNFLAGVRPLARPAKRLGGIAEERELPRPAPVPFTRWYGRWMRKRSVEEVAEQEELIGEERIFEGRPLRPDETADALAEAGFPGEGDEENEGDEAHEPPEVVVLWTDTFTEYLSPSVGRAALRVLEAAGMHVIVPPTLRMRRKPAWLKKREAGEEVTLTQWKLTRTLFTLRQGRVCCGLTYISTGQLDRARAVLRRTLDLLDVFLDPVPHRMPAEDPDLAPPPIPIVVLEPSCAATLRTDLPELLPDDPRARQLADSVVTFAEALERYAPNWTPPALDRPVVGQTHCHQHAILGDAPDRRLRAAAGLTGDLSGGCCGLAGNFGFEKGHYDVSVACAEDQLLPSVREAPDDALILADGFSCRTQLEQLAGRRGRHLAEVLAEGLEKD
ncbi:FAD-binding and (Fe-S)-binding domain-containing protein [Streptomyces ipomoeae]|nr:FAD-binding and (Fe-S)-binding domain-containing protein [Streptomyces ipomoeae]MDX2696544.1 FAD-binding and (Fe-S)-binding domain-containing protein [Streptomyces ipomoeae]MDX2824638.1 FAD-binding and (Fe-S)-binding domain-containing protein [Streptomyces ipomoeae]MDX2841950.1 FAD-binding and (Fe-S)-binding domain-containing protein [Streptomyces ipomoeae]MDX2879393.1 FAD-binding and (Fe-S)-binding domain-containing protein [Streptomyces ipomoeae]